MESITCIGLWRNWPVGQGERKQFGLKINRPEVNLSPDLRLCLCWGYKMKERPPVGAAFWSCKLRVEWESVSSAAFRRPFRGQMVPQLFPVAQTGLLFALRGLPLDASRGG